MAADDEVLIKITADIAQAVAAMNKMVEQVGAMTAAMQKMGDQTQKNMTIGSFFGQQLSKAFDTVKDAALGVVTSIPSMVKGVEELGDSLLSMSQRTGISVENLSQMRFVASQAGVSFELLGRTIQTMGVEIQQGSVNTVTAIEAIGLSYETLRKQSPVDQFRSVMKALSGIEDASERTARGVAILGPKFRLMSNLAKEDIDGLLKKADELGLTMSTETAKAADDYGDSLDRLRKSMEATRNQIGAALLKPLTAVNDLVGEMVAGPLLLLGEQVVNVGKAIGSAFISQLPLLIQQMGGWQKAMLELEYATGLMNIRMAYYEGGLKRVMGLTALSEAATAAYGLVQKASAAYTGAQTVATGLWSAAQVIATGTTTALTGAVARLNAVLLANPIVRVIALITALIGALTLLYQMYKKSQAEQEEAGKQAVKSIQDQIDAGARLSIISETIAQKERERIEALKKRDFHQAALLESQIKAIQGDEKLKDAQLALNVAVRNGASETSNLTQANEALAEAVEKVRIANMRILEAQGKIKNGLKELITVQDRGTTALAGWSEESKNLLAKAILLGKTDEEIMSKVQGLNKASLADIRKQVKATNDLQLAEKDLARERADLGKSGVSGALAAQRRQEQKALDALQLQRENGDIEAEAKAKQIIAEGVLARQKIQIDAAKETAAQLAGIDTEAAIAHVQATRTGLDAELAVIEIRKNAQIAQIKAAKDYATEASKISAAEVTAEQERTKLITAARLKVAEEGLQQREAFMQQEINIGKQGIAAELALIDQRAAEQERQAQKELGDTQAFEDKKTQIQTQAQRDRAMAFFALDKEMADRASEERLRAMEYEVEQTKYGIDKIEALRDIEWQRTKKQLEDRGYLESQIEEERVRFRAETNRRIAAGDQETQRGLTIAAEAARDAYVKSRTDMSLSDQKRLELLEDANKKEAAARGVQYTRTKEYYEFLLEIQEKVLAAEVKAGLASEESLRKLRAAIQETKDALENLKGISDLGPTQADYDKQAQQAEDNYQRMLRAGDAFSKGQIAAAKRAADEAKRMQDKQYRDLVAAGIKTKAQVKDEYDYRKAVFDDLVARRKAGDKDVTDTMIVEAGKRLQTAEEEAFGVQSAWLGVIGSIADGMEQIANITQGFGAAFGSKMAGNIGKVAAEVSRGIGTTLVNVERGQKQLDILQDEGATKSQKRAAKVGMALQAAEGIMEFGAATDKRTRGQRALGGAVAGAKIGAVAGPWGAAIGAGVGAIVGALRHPGWVKQAEEIMRDFGTDISDELAKSIEAEAKEKFKGDRAAASIFNLDKIIEEAGGLKSDNFDKFTGKLRDVFVQLDQGKFTADQARETLDKNFGAFAQHVLDSGKVASKQFQEIIQLNTQFATGSKQIADFVSGQFARFGGALNQMIGPFVENTERMQDLRDEITETTKAIADSDDDKKRGELNKHLKDLQKEYDTLKSKTDLSSESLARYERLAVAGFNAAIKSGVGYVEAIGQISPALDAIAAANKEAGREGSAAIKELLQFREVAKANEDLVNSAASLNEVMLALSNIGGLNTETMADLQAQGLDTFNKLKAAGFTENQALQQMKGFLEGVRDAHEELGTPIDENTQALIGQAEQAGILKKKQVETNDVLMEGFSAIIEAVGGKIPEAFQKWKQSATDAAAQIAPKVTEVNDALMMTNNTLEGVPWEEFANSGTAAATLVGTTITDSLNGSLVDTSDALADTKWKQYAKDGVTAGTLAARSVSGVEDSVHGVRNQLENTEWGQWADEAVKAAQEAQAAVDAVSFGSSPGGLKEISLKLMENMRAFSAWEQQGVDAAESLKDAIDVIHLGKASPYAVGAAGGAAAYGDWYRAARQMRTADITAPESHSELERRRGGYDSDGIHINISAMDTTGFEHFIETKMLPSLNRVLRKGGRNLADFQGALRR